MKVPSRRVVLIGAWIAGVLVAGSATGFAIATLRQPQAARSALHHNSTGATTATPDGAVPSGTADTGSQLRASESPAADRTPGPAAHCIFSSGRPPSTDAITPLAPSSAPASALGVMVLADNPTTQTVALFGSDGRVIASARAVTRAPLSCVDPQIGTLRINLPFVSTSTGRVYFLDGDSDIRYLAPDGSTGLAARVPGSASTPAVFVVSPDDRQIAVIVFDFSVLPARLHLFVQNLDGSHRVNLPIPSDAYVLPVGWHGHSLILETVRTLTYYSSYSPLQSEPSTFVLVDPGTGSVITRIGSTACTPQASLPSASGFTCKRQPAPSQAMTWTGTIAPFSPNVGPGGASLSPDGAHIAACCFGGAGIKIFTSNQRGGGETTTSAEGYPDDGGWLDNSHVVYRRKSSASPWILDLTTGATTQIAPDGFLVGRLPGGF